MNRPEVLNKFVKIKMVEGVFKTEEVILTYGEQKACLDYIKFLETELSKCQLEASWKKPPPIGSNEMGEC